MHVFWGRPEIEHVWALQDAANVGWLDRRAEANPDEGLLGAEIGILSVAVPF
jgi:hypothetical protein